MNNNDVLRRLRYVFDFDDAKMINIFSLAEFEVSREQICNWLKGEEDDAFEVCSDTQLAIFLNGLINEKRGKKDGPQLEPESRLTNNIIFIKLKIALNLKAEDVLELLELANFRFSKHELSAFFRRPNHKHYRECKDQVLRNFIKGLQIHYRGVSTSEETIDDTSKSKQAASDDAESDSDMPDNAAPNSIWGNKG